MPRLDTKLAKAKLALDVSAALRDFEATQPRTLTPAPHSESAQLRLACLRLIDQIGLDPFPVNVSRVKPRKPLTVNEARENLTAFARRTDFKVTQRNVLAFLEDQVRNQLARCNFATPSKTLILRTYGCTVYNQFMLDCVLPHQTGYKLPDGTLGHTKVNAFAIAAFMYAAVLTMRDNVQETRMLYRLQRVFKDLHPELHDAALVLLKTDPLRYS